MLGFFFFNSLLLIDFCKGGEAVATSPGAEKLRLPFPNLFPAGSQQRDLGLVTHWVLHPCQHLQKPKRAPPPTAALLVPRKELLE